MARGQRGKAVVLGVLAALLVALAAGSAGADSYKWTGKAGGTNSGIWDHINNWDPKVIPNSYSAQAIIILQDTSKYPISLSTTIFLGGSIGDTYGDNALYIGPNAGDASGVALTISGTLGMQGNISNAKTIVISGTLQNDSGKSGTPQPTITNYSISSPSGSTGTISLQGGTIGTLSGGGWIFNQAVSGYGTISAPVTNNSTITASGGTLTLRDYTFSGGTINPGSASISLRNATLKDTTLGSGTVNTYTGTTNTFTGTVGSSATLGIVSGSTLNVNGTLNQSNTLTNSGTLGLSGTLKQTGNITNNGTFNILGTLNQGGTNTSSYSIGGTGSLSLQGGTIGTVNGGSWTFNQAVSGWGTISAPVVNNATVTLSSNSAISNTFTNNKTVNLSGTPTISGAFTNNSGGTLNVTGGTTTISGNFTNQGTVSANSGTTVTVTGTNSKKGSFTSSGGTQSFGNLKVEQYGYLVGGTGTFTVSGNFLNYSTQNNQLTGWNTTQATLAFTSGSHEMYLAGVDKGQVTYGSTAPYSTYADNFAWGTLSIAPGGSLVLKDSFPDDGNTAALYVGVISGLVFDKDTGLITNISGDFNIYYDPYKNDFGFKTFKLASGTGKVMSAVVPLPGSVWLLGSGLVGLLLVCRRRRRRI
ncbi:MAG: hypothetical protein WHT07_08085 [Desulfobaccales bacterium]